jgi:predicted signal transduction protein with EAL and GGDEF domain
VGAGGFRAAVAAVYLARVALHLVFGLFFALTLVCAARGLGLYGVAIASRRPAVQPDLVTATVPTADAGS